VNITKKQAEKQGYVPMKVEVEVMVDPTTGNILYLCQHCDKLMDRFIFLTDPCVIENKTVNVLCKDGKAKWQRQAFPTTTGNLIADQVKIFIEDNWKPLTMALAKRLFKEKGWFKDLFPEA